jgi:preprotein translocase subunit SecG
LGTALLALCLLANFAIDRGDQTESAVQRSGVEMPVQQQNESPSAVPVPENQGGNNADTGDGGN